jgi:hypothetical protein
LEGGLHTIGKNTKALAVAIKENEQGVNADKTKHVVMTRHQNAGRSPNIKINFLFPFKVWKLSNIWKQP